MFLTAQPVCVSSKVGHTFPGMAISYFPLSSNTTHPLFYPCFQLLALRYNFYFVYKNLSNPNLLPSSSTNSLYLTCSCAHILYCESGGRFSLTELYLIQSLHLNFCSIPSYIFMKSFFGLFPSFSCIIKLASPQNMAGQVRVAIEMDFLATLLPSIIQNFTSPFQNLHWEYIIRFYHHHPLLPGAATFMIMKLFIFLV